MSETILRNATDSRQIGQVSRLRAVCMPEYKVKSRSGRVSEQCVSSGAAGCEFGHICLYW